MANQLILGRALDANGYIAPGAKATIYADGTSTLIAVYSDVAGTIAAANPIVADADGLWPQRYVTEDAKAVVTTSAGVTIYTLDPVPVAAGSGAAASQISFTPSVSPSLPQTNVQDAIIAAANLGVSGFAAFGLGVTGNATLLANLDATGTGAGIYRFDGTTTGTFPTGVAAGDTGAVELWRQTGATAMMELHHATSNRVFRRRLTTSVWGAWREVVNVDQATVQGDLVYRGASDFQRLPKGTAGQFLKMNSGATAPEWASGQIAAYANFNGVPVSGTYSRTGTLVTVTLTSHGMTTGHYAYLDFTSGTATDGYYQITSTGANTFTVVDAASGATSGNVTRNIWTRKSLNIASITRGGTGRYTATFASAMADADFVFIAHAGEVTNRLTESVSINALGTLPTSTTVTFYTGFSGGDGVPATAAVDNAYVHFVVYP